MIFWIGPIFGELFYSIDYITVSSKAFNNLTDQEILIRLRSHDRAQQNEAFEAIYLEVYPRVKNFILKKNGTEALSLDLFQDAIIVFFNQVKSGKFQEASTISTYLHGIVHNLWRVHLRNEKKMPRAELSPYEMDLVQDEDRAHVDLGKVMTRLLNELGDGCKQLIQLYYYERKTMQEIKDHFALGSEQTAKNKKYRCMQQLIKLFKSSNITKESILSPEK